MDYIDIKMKEMMKTDILRTVLFLVVKVTEVSLHSKDSVFLNSPLR